MKSENFAALTSFWAIGRILDLEQDTHELRSDNTALRVDIARLHAQNDQQPARNP